MGSLLVLSLTTLTPLMPWRTRLAKWADMAMGHILVLVMLAAGPMIIIDQSQGEFTASAMLAILCLALPSAAFVCSCLLLVPVALTFQPVLQRAATLDLLHWIFQAILCPRSSAGSSVPAGCACKCRLLREGA